MNTIVNSGEHGLIEAVRLARNGNTEDGARMLRPRTCSLERCYGATIIRRRSGARS